MWFRIVLMRRKMSLEIVQNTKYVSLYLKDDNDVVFNYNVISSV